MLSPTGGLHGSEGKQMLEMREKFKKIVSKKK